MGVGARFLCASFLAVTASVMMVACAEPAGPPLGRTYRLSTVNGQPVPYREVGIGGDTSSALFLMNGWVTILDGSRAERHASLARIVQTSSGDSLRVVGEWTYTGRYLDHVGSILIEYGIWSPGQLGPDRRVDTLAVRLGRLTLRETGFVPPIDSMVRVYCQRSLPC